MPPDRLRELLQFNFLPTLDIDDSWWQPEWLAGASSSPLDFPGRAHFHLSRFFLEQIGLADQFDFDFSPLEKRIALLSSQRLKRLVYLVGLTLQSQRIAHAIRGSDRQAIKKSIGEEDYFFVTKRGVTLLKEAGVQSPPVASGDDRFDDLNERCYRVGMGSLATVMQSFPTAFIRRLQLKLPRDMVEKYWQACDADRSTHLFCLLKLEREMNRAWPTW